MILKTIKLATCKSQIFRKYMDDIHDAPLKVKTNLLNLRRKHLNSNDQINHVNEYYIIRY